MCGESRRTKVWKSKLDLASLRALIELWQEALTRRSKGIDRATFGRPHPQPEAPKLSPEEPNFGETLRRTGDRMSQWSMLSANRCFGASTE